MTLQTVLCPTDFSSYSLEALRYASTLAAEAGAKLHILHVIDESAAYCTEYTGMGFMSDMTQKLEHESEHLLDNVSPTESGVEFERHLVLGNPIPTILEFVKDHEVGLVVMGSHGRTGISRLLMGSVAEAVVRGAGCPVLTVKHSTVKPNGGGRKPSTPPSAQQPHLN